MKSPFTAMFCSFAMVAALFAQNSTLPAARQRAITEKDLFDFIWVANPQLSPDGSRVAFTRVNVDEKRTGYETSIWTVRHLRRRASPPDDQRQARRPAAVVAGW